MGQPKLPQFTVLSDHFNLQEGSVADQDLFALEGRLRPIYDILRHKDTAAPLSLALYGGAGTGKTTALRWLKEQVGVWNAISVEERAGHPRVLPIWFTATDVPVDESAGRRLVAEIVLQCLENLPDESMRTDYFKEAAVQCAGALGVEFYGRLSRLGRSWGLDESLVREVCLPAGDFAEWETSYCACLDFTAMWQDDWAKIGESVRIAVLIDDLDHCRPERMMEILDMVAVRLKSAVLIFVVGLDQDVASKLVARHYKEHGYGEGQIRHYLGKVFQAECQIEPAPQQVECFYNEQLLALDRRMGGLLKTHLPDPSKTYIDAAIMYLSSGNPRKIKMLLNSAMMKAYSAYCQENAEHRISIIRFLQRTQIYLLQRWLSHFPAGSSAMYRKEVQDWFTHLSEEARKPNSDYEKSIMLPQEQVAAGDAYRRPASRGFVAVDLSPPEGLSYSMIHRWTWDLLKIPFDAGMTIQKDESAAEIMSTEKVMTEQAAQMGSAGLISTASEDLKNAIAASLEKDADALADEDLAAVVNLDFSGKKIPESDFPIIARMKQLIRLNLACCEMLDLSPLSGLMNLQQLDLSYTTASDLSPLNGLEQLETLVLYGGAVKSLESIRGMKSLQKLNLSHTELSDKDLEVVETLPGLNHLFLRGTAVSEKRAAELSQATGYAVRVEL